MLTSTVALTGLSITCVDHRAARPLLRRQEGEISTRPALAPVPALVVVAVAVVDRRRQEASLRAEEVVEAEAEVVRLAKVRRRAAVLLLAEASEEVGAARVEVEPLPVVTLAPELPHQVAQVAGNFTKSLRGFSLPTQPAVGQKASAERPAEMLLDGSPIEQWANRLRALSSALSRGNNEETRHRAGQIAQLKAG
jgi:hypothetical protein